MKKRFTEAQIVGFLEADAGFAVRDLCLNHGFAEANYDLWRGKFGGMSVRTPGLLLERLASGGVRLGASEIV